MTTSVVDAAIAEAENFDVPLDELVIVTTADEDPKVGRYVLQLSQARRSAGKFEVHLWCWEEMADRIRSSPPILRTFYREWWRTPSFLFCASLLAVTIALATAGTVFSDRLKTWYYSQDAHRRTTAEGTQLISATLSEIHAAFGSCVHSMSGKPFVFSSELRERCVQSVELPLRKLERQRDQYASTMVASAFTEVELVNRYIAEEFRQNLISVEMASHFEGEAVNAAKVLCPKAGYRVSSLEEQKVRLRKAGRDALSAQLERYFKIRDFVIPGLDALKARMALISREQSGQDIPADLLEQAKSFNGRIAEENAYTFQLFELPFSTARGKDFSTRNLRISAPPGEDPVEEAVWSQVAEIAFEEGLPGRPSDVDYLIACGFLKQGARTLIKRIDANPPESTAH